jgi:hypothetical protein
LPRPCECGDESAGSIKCGDFLTDLISEWLFKKYCAQWSEFLALRLKEKELLNIMKCLEKSFAVTS